LKINIQKLQEQQYKKNKYAEAVMDTLEGFGINSVELTSSPTFFKYDNYEPKIKQNLQAIIKDATILKLNEKGLVDNSEIDKIKVRLTMESSMDDMSTQNIITKDAFGYTIKEGMQLNSEKFGGSHPLEYCVKNDIKMTIDGKDA